MRASPLFRARAPFWRSNRVCALFFAMVTLLEIPVVVSPGRGGVGLQAVAGAFLAAILWLCWRALWCATVTADDHHLVAYTLLRTRKWAWPDVAGIEVISGPVGALAYERLLLLVRLADGHSVRLTELNFSPRSEKGQRTIHEAEQRLRGFIRSPEAAGQA